MAQISIVANTLSTKQGREAYALAVGIVAAALATEREAAVPRAGSAMTTLPPERVAEKATPGPWGNCRGFVRSTAHGTTHDFPGGTVTASTLWVAECRNGEAFYNADGNAALDPQTVLALLSAVEALQAENATMREQIEASQMRRLEIGDDIKDKLAQKLAEAELTTARVTAAREMREECAAVCDGEPHKMDSEMRSYGREFGERIRALPLPSEKERGS